MKCENNKIGKTAIQMVMRVFFFFAVIYSFSGQAQVFGLVSMIAEHPVSKVKAFGKVNHFLRNGDPNAKPISLSSFMNSRYEDIITRGGNRIYFSYRDHPANANGVNDPRNIWYAEGNPLSATGDPTIRGNPDLKKGKMHAGLSYSVNVDRQWSLPLSIDIRGHYKMPVHTKALVWVRNGKLTWKL